MLQLVDEAESMLTTRQRSVCEFARMKRTLTQKSTNSKIDEIYYTRPSSGALRGKQLGGRAAADLAVRGTAGAASGVKARLTNLRSGHFSFLSNSSHVVIYEPEAPHDQTLAQKRSLF
jgi:galactokinase/mevalonate kinase-like predicted kinase